MQYTCQNNLFYNSFFINKIAIAFHGFFIHFFGLSNKLNKKEPISGTHKKRKQLQLICTFVILIYRN